MAILIKDWILENLFACFVWLQLQDCNATITRDSWARTWAWPSTLRHPTLVASDVTEIIKTGSRKVHLKQFSKLQEEKYEAMYDNIKYKTR